MKNGSKNNQRATKVPAPLFAPVVLLKTFTVCTHI